jgi:hypothetical protein
MLVLNASHANIPTPEGANEDGWQIQICYTDEEMETLLAGYEEASSTSPSALVCRPTLRAILNVVKGV